MKHTFPPLTPDDPRLTAFALGEIEDPAERAFIEESIAALPKLKQNVEDTQSLSAQLKEVLEAEPLPEIEQLEETASVVHFPSSRTLAMAASFTMVLGLGVSSVYVLQNSEPEIEEVYEIRKLSTASPATQPVAPIESIGRAQTSLKPSPSGSSVPAREFADGFVVLEEQNFTLESFSVDSNVSVSRSRREPVAQGAFNTESYAPIEDTGFKSPLHAPLSTFSVDVDTASYANIRRLIQNGQVPPADAVRVEELINRFDYAYPVPDADAEHPFSTQVNLAAAPWALEHAVVRIGLQGHEIAWNERPASNLVFLLDVSGSMNSPNKLPLVKKTAELLVRRMSAQDRIAVVVYAGNSGVALPSTTADNHETIIHAINELRPGGSTAGAAGIELAYKIAQEHFITGGNNRVILCTDGDFNVGISDHGSLRGVIEEKAASGVFLSVLGFGMGNYKDDMLEMLSNSGNGTYAYIDSEREARRVFLRDLTGSLFTIAKDVKVQVEFNPTHIQAYRLIGYENRRLADEDFNNDRKDAGDIGAGHSVTALYEIVPTGIELNEHVRQAAQIDALKYTSTAPTSDSNEWLTVKLRYKEPDGDTSQLLSKSLEQPIDLPNITTLDNDFRWSTAVAMFGEKLRNNSAVEGISWQVILDLARSATGPDPFGDRAEFLTLVQRAGTL